MIKKLTLLFTLSVILSASYLREIDGEDGVVLDTKTNLIWQDSALVEKSWQDAITYCEGLEIGIYKDWKLPNYTELYSIVDLSKSLPSQSDVFKEKSLSSYWTSTIYEPEKIWTIDFTLGSNDFNIVQESELKVRCVHIR